MKQGYFIAALGVLAVLGLVIHEPYFLHILILCFIWTIVVSGWDLVLGFAGLANFAQLAFFAIGAYGTGMAAFGGMPSVTSILIGMAAAGLFGFVVGLPCLRLRGEYVALFTFAIHLALPPLIRQGRPIGTGGSTGLLGIPPLRIGDLALTPQDKFVWYYVALGVAAICIYVIYFGVLRGRWGWAFIAIRDSEAFAKSLGVNDYKYKLVVFTLSATITGLAGGLYAHYVGVVTPKILETEFFLIVMVMLSVGGLGRFPGVILGAFIVTIGNEFLREAGQYRLLLLGLIVVLSVLFLPKGIVELSDYRKVAGFKWLVDLRQQNRKRNEARKLPSR